MRKIGVDHNTYAYCTDTLALSFEVTDDDEDFAQRVCPRCDSHPSAQYRTGKFVSADMPRVTAILTPAPYR